MGTPFPYRPLWTDNLLAKRQRAAYRGTVGPGGSPTGLRTQARNKKFFTLFSKAGSNVVESAAILVEFVAALHERWVEFSKRVHHTEHAGDDTNLGRRVRHEDAAVTCGAAS